MEARSRWVRSLRAPRRLIDPRSPSASSGRTSARRTAGSTRPPSPSSSPAPSAPSPASSATSGARRSTGRRPRAPCRRSSARPSPRRVPCRPGGGEALQRQQLLRAAGGAGRGRGGDPRARRALRPRHRGVPPPPDRRPLPALRRAARRPPGGRRWAWRRSTRGPAAAEQGADPRRFRPRRRDAAKRGDRHAGLRAGGRAVRAAGGGGGVGGALRRFTPSSRGRSASR